MVETTKPNALDRSVSTGPKALPLSTDLFYFFRISEQRCCVLWSLRKDNFFFFKIILGMSTISEKWNDNRPRIKSKSWYVTSVTLVETVVEGKKSSVPWRPELLIKIFEAHFQPIHWSNTVRQQLRPKKIPCPKKFLVTRLLLVFVKNI